MMRFVFLLWVLITIHHGLFAQYGQTASFTTLNGLPGNFVYKCLEDQDGFLWVATDQGLARFDGKTFYVFTTEQGLPDNDVLTLMMEQSGRIWVKGSNGRVAYFDTLRNRFVHDAEDQRLQVLSLDMLARPYTLPHDGIFFPMRDTSYSIHGNRWTAYAEPKLLPGSSIIHFLPDKSEIRLLPESQDRKGNYLFHTKGHQVLDSLLIPEIPLKSRFYVYGDSVFAFTSESSFAFIMHHFQGYPLKANFDQIPLSGPYYWHNQTGRYLMMIYKDGKIEGFRRGELKSSLNVNCSFLPNSAFDDRMGNLWISSHHNGLLLFQQRQIKRLTLPDDYVSLPWQCVNKSANGLAIGSSSGLILDINDKSLHVSHRTKSGNTDIIRAIYSIGGNLYSFGEEGIFVNHKNEIPSIAKACKSAIVWNDSTIICGFRNAIGILNTRNNHLSEINAPGIYANSLCKMGVNELYVGAQDGLYRFQLGADGKVSMATCMVLMRERVVGLASNSDSLLWVATATAGVVVLKNNRVVARVNTALGLRTNNLLTIHAGRPGQIWVGSNKGISILHYQQKKPWIQNLSTHDGLSSDVINQFCFFHDTMYVATEQGISILPAHVSIPSFDIPIQLTGLQINQRDSFIRSNYTFPAGRYTINLQFSGIELSGHFLQAQYSLDRGFTWTGLNENSLNLQLSSGDHHVWLRALDVNGHQGSKILKLTFNVDEPFYRKIWFFALLAGMIVIATVVINNRIHRKKREKHIRELLHQRALDELEIQALKAQINPHFVFNCLNSIKGLIYEEDLDTADDYLDKFAMILRSTLNYSSKPSISLSEELVYIETYLSLEKLRFGTKFNYAIDVDSDIERSAIQIPAMLLQPYVENAIKHGVCNLDRDSGLIHIRAHLASGKLRICVEDNGVGRAHAQMLGKQQNRQYESKGTALTNRRIELYQIDLLIEDLVDTEGKPRGTRIQLDIPIPLPQYLNV